VQGAAIGLGTPHLASALATPLPAVLYHAGGLAARSRSAERLRGMLCEETGADVQIVEFAGGWVRLPPSEQSRLAAPGQPGRYVQLGVDAALGSQVWDPPARFLVRLGPLSLRDFEALLPGTPLHTRLVELTRLLVGPEQDFAFNPSLAAAEVPPLRLVPGPQGAARLGWTSWLTSPRPRRQPSAAAMLQPATT
jgi:type VI secretion system protein ImpH